MYGDIISEWALEGKNLNMQVVVPPNTTAVLKLPGVSASSVKENGRSWTHSEGIELISQKDHIMSFLLQPGVYRFSAVMDVLD